MQETTNLIYDYQNLDMYFKDIAGPVEAALHLGQLLYFLVYYEHTEGIQGFYELYSDIFELKRVLQNMVKAG